MRNEVTEKIEYLKTLFITQPDGYNKVTLFLSKLAYMKIFLKLFLLLFFFISVPAFSQDGGKESKKNEVENRKAKRKKAKAEWKARREKERGEKNAVKSHEKRLQTKETRKRMKKNRQKAARVNGNKREFFIIRWFKPKPRTGPR